MQEFTKLVHPVCWKKLPYGLLIYFGSEKDLEQLREEPPQKLPPIFIRAHRSAILIKLLKDSLGLKIAVEPSLLAKRDDQLARARAEIPPEIPWEFAGYEARRALIFMQQKPCNLAQLMENLATYLGGECERTDHTWRLRNWVNGEQLQRWIAKLLDRLQDEEQSFYHREYLEDLIVVGEPAVPSLLKSLSPKRPVLSGELAYALGEISDKRAVKPLIGMLSWQMPTEDESGDLFDVRTAVVEALGKLGDRQAVKPLKALSKTKNIEPDLGNEIRIALARLAPETIPERKWPRQVKTKPGELGWESISKEQTPFGGHVHIERECRDDRGKKWGAFFFSRYGGQSDIWLTRSKDNKTWGEFLFTGCTTRQARARGPEAKIINVSVEKAHVNLTWESREITQQGKRVPVKHRITISLAGLRLDSDGDGATDLLERRLRTNPKEKDTDGDGLNDAEDGNPLVAFNRNPSDEQQILQATFEHLVRPEPCEEIKLVVIVELGKQEFYGYPGVVLCLTGEEVAKFLEEVGCGVEIITFEREKQVSEGKWLPINPIVFQNRGKKAIVRLCTFRDGLWGAGYRVVLEKKRGRWLVTDWKMLWIS